MKRIKNNNSGFTLVELIIAMAVLAFLMTAVGSLMGSSVASHRKQKAEIRVHTAAQQTYNQITDSIMQAREVVIVGYETSTPYNFTEPGTKVTDSPSLVYYVKDAEMADFIKDNPKVFGTMGSDAAGTNIKYFSDLDSDKVIYVKTIAIMTSAPIDLDYVPTGNKLQVDQYNIFLMDTLADGGTALVNVGIKQNASGTDVYLANDKVVNIYSFEGANMYYEKQYAYMTLLNDISSPNYFGTVASNKSDCIYNQGLSYVTLEGTTPVDVSACMVTVDADNGAIGIEILFNDKNMTYTTQGMINIRNSYVLKGKDN